MPSLILPGFSTLIIDADSILLQLTLSTANLIQKRDPTLPAGWSYKGCYVDNANGRILINQQPDDAALTVEKCVALCKNAGYSVSGMEYSTRMYPEQSIALLVLFGLNHELFPRG